MINQRNCPEYFYQPHPGLTTLHANRFCDDELPIDPNDERGITSNQALAGKAHPRTKIPPIIISRPYDFEYWRANPIDVVSRVNKRTAEYPGLAGYNVEQLVDRDLVGLEAPHDDRYINTNYKNPLIQTLQPGVYTNPVDYEPILDNLGISETPQFEKNLEVDLPTLNRPGVISENVFFERVNGNEDIYENYEPINLNSKKQVFTSNRPKNPGLNYNMDQELNNYNIYDPRFSGYGSDNRNYLEPMVNQQRYYYDDINAIRMPNYIVRSKLDSCITGYADTYGPMQRTQLTLNEVRPLAEKSYLDNNMNFRNDMMESLLRKRNAEMWQVRQAPKYTMKQTLK